MTDNRREAKPIPGEHCRFCGAHAVPLVETPCCHQWICCDTAFVSIHGGDRCQVAHERFTLCYSPYSDGHAGPWHTCRHGREFWTPAEYKAYAEHPLNVPRY